MIYKIISKILVRGRNISNNILIAHELFDMLRKMEKRKKFYGALKIDISKAYDRVDWKFLKAVLVAMDFSSRWVRWILECVTTIQYTILVNGRITQSFKPNRGLRQGIRMPLSIATLLTEGLVVIMFKIKD